MRGVSGHNSVENRKSWFGAPSFEGCRGSGRRLSRVVVGGSGVLRESSWDRWSWYRTSWEPLFQIFLVFYFSIFSSWSLKYHLIYQRPPRAAAQVRRLSRVVGQGGEQCGTLRESWVKAANSAAPFESRGSRRRTVRRPSRVVAQCTGLRESWHGASKLEHETFFYNFN